MAWPTVVAGHSTEKDYSMTTKKPAPLPISELTLFDWYAAFAMQALIEKFSVESAVGPAVITHRAHEMADAMLAERPK